MSHKKKKKRGPVSKKISKLMHEGAEQDQAVATALNMKRKGRLTKEGGYIRVGSKKRKTKRRARRGNRRS